MEKLEHLAAEVNAITLEDLGMGILDVQISVILFVDELRYQVEKRDSEKKGMLSDSYELLKMGRGEILSRKVLIEFILLTVQKIWRLSVWN